MRNFFRKRRKQKKLSKNESKKSVWNPKFEFKTVEVENEWNERHKINNRMVYITRMNAELRNVSGSPLNRQMLQKWASFLCLGKNWPFVTLSTTCQHWRVVSQFSSWKSILMRDPICVHVSFVSFLKSENRRNRENDIQLNCEGSTVEYSGLVAQGATRWHQNDRWHLNDGYQILVDVRCRLFTKWTSLSLERRRWESCTKIAVETLGSIKCMKLENAKIA